MSRIRMGALGALGVATAACGSLSRPDTLTEGGEAPPASEGGDATAALFSSSGMAGEVSDVPPVQTEPFQRFTAGDADTSGCSADLGALGWRQRIAMAAARQGTRSSRVAVDGDTALVGLPAAENGGIAVFVRRRGEVWCPEFTVQDSGFASNSEFGHAVALADDVAAIGAPGEVFGSVLVLRRGEAGWSKEAQLVSPEQSSRAFGEAVAISGQRLLVGAPGYEQATGGAYIFEYSNAAWDSGRTLAAPLLPADRFGSAVALDEDSVVVGAPGTANGQGAVYAFAPNDDGSAAQALSVPGEGEQFGAAIAVEGDDLVVGAPAHGLPNGTALVELIPLGRAYAFRRTATGWGEASIVSDGDLSTLDHLGSIGSSVALSGGTLLVGAGGEENGRGVVRVSRKASDGSWCPMLMLDAGERVIYSNFGSSVAVSGRTAWVGSLEPSSAAYFFDLPRVPTKIESCFPPPASFDGQASPPPEEDLGPGCDDLRDHILQRLQTEIERGVLVGDAIPCGLDGVGNRPDSFDSHLSQAEVDRVSSEFRELCAQFEEQC